MRAFTVLLISILVCVPLLGQTPAPKTPSPSGSQITTPFGPIPNPAVRAAEIKAEEDISTTNWDTQIFQTRYVDTSELRVLLSLFRCTLQAAPHLNAIAVKAPKEVMPAIADTIKRFDVPSSVPKTVELTAYLILASPEAGVGPEMPAALRPVMEQMRNIFSYKYYTVMDTDYTRVRHGERFTASGILERLSAADSNSEGYKLNGVIRVSGEGNDETVRVDNFLCEFSNPGFTPQISTSVDIKKNQQVVVGKGTFKDRALILVMSAKVVE